MYETFLSIITSGDYKLTDITKKINTMWITGNLTDDQRDNLLSQAAEHLDPETERPENLEMMEKLTARVTDLEKRVSELEGKSENTGYPEWVPWDGLSDNYQNGAIVSHNGKLWKSTYVGQNVWEPGTAGAESLLSEYQEQNDEQEA